MKELRRNFFKYVFLNIASMVSLSIYILVDTYFIAQATGSNGMAALNLSLPVYGIMYGIAHMIGVGFGTRFKIKYDDYDEKNRIFSKGLFFVTIISIFFIIIGIFFADNILYLMGARGDVLELASIYLGTALKFAPSFMISALISSFVRNDHNPGVVTTSVIVSCIFNATFDYVFMFILNMGIFGAALATGLSPILATIIVMSHFIFKKNSFKLVKTKVRLSEFFYLSSLGISSLITNISMSVVLIVFNSIMLKYAGNIGVAAYGVIANMADVAFSIFNGVGSGMQPLVSENYAKKKTKEIIYILKLAIGLSFIISAIIYSTLYFNAEVFTNVFNSQNDKQLLAYGVQGIRLYYLATPFIAINIVMAMSMQAMAKPRLSFIIAILRGVVILVPMAFIFSNMYHIVGLWVSYVLTEGIVASISIFMMSRYVKA